jgi:hypothetical protein
MHVVACARRQSDPGWCAPRRGSPKTGGHLSGAAKLPISHRKAVETLPTRRKRLKRSEFKIYLDTMRRLRGAIVVAIRKIWQSEQRDYQQRYLAVVGQIFLDAPPDVLEGFILTRRNQAGRNLHAAALARMRAATPQQLSEWAGAARRRGGKSARSVRRLDPRPPLPRL